jgi:hypothetical protein
MVAPPAFDVERAPRQRPGQKANPRPRVGGAAIELVMPCSGGLVIAPYGNVIEVRLI